MSVQKFNSEEEIDEAIKKMLNMIETEKTKTNDLPLHHARRKSREMVVNKLVTKNLADLYAAKAEWTQNKAGSSGASGNAINEASLYAEIKKEENLVSEAKAKDSKSLETKDAIAKLLDLKKQYTTATGKHYNKI
uniref:WHEP-TRS domain-containing protein n=1 Tax=Panagrolaimus sp. ES5 TaxID=591445 RepID=A0AC34GC10_9BILA